MLVFIWMCVMAQAMTPGGHMLAQSFAVRAPEVLAPARDARAEIAARRRAPRYARLQPILAR